MYSKNAQLLATQLRPWAMPAQISEKCRKSGKCLQKYTIVVYNVTLLYEYTIESLNKRNAKVKYHIHLDLSPSCI